MILPRQAAHPAPDLTISRIGDLLAIDLERPPSPSNIDGDNMKPTQKLHDLGQSLWLDNITNDLLTSGTLKRYIDEWSVTGLTSNPTIFDHAIKGSTAYDAPIRDLLAKGALRRSLVLRYCACRPDQGGRSLQADLGEDQWRRWLCLARSLAAACL